MTAYPIRTGEREYKSSGGGINTGKPEIHASIKGGEGNWISVSTPPNKAGIVKVKTMHFASRKDLLEYAKDHKYNIKE